MDLLITCTGDITSDLLCERASPSVLRVNLEQWRDYDFDLYDLGFRIEDKYGRRVDELNLGNIIWRKPVDDLDPVLGDEWFAFHEFRYAIKSIINRVIAVNPGSVPIDPFCFSKTDKFKQLTLAKKFFSVPAWRMTTHPNSFSNNRLVTKSVTGRPIPGTGIPPKVVFTIEVDPGRLDHGWPWFLQERVDARFDLTVVHVDGSNFGFSLDRSLFPGLDWRKSIGTEATKDQWTLVQLNDDLASRINLYMMQLGLRFGRLDFLVPKDIDSDPVFLEVNPNGQWAWLDLDQSNGLFDTMVGFLFSHSR